MDAPSAEPRPHAIEPSQAGDALTQMRQRQTQRLWLMALGWTVVVCGVGAWLIDRAVTEQRLDRVSQAEQRLDTLHNNLDVTFEQFSALPKALSRQSAVIGYMKEHSAAGMGQPLVSDDPARRQTALMLDASVHAMSQSLKDTAQDFALTSLYLVDRQGIVNADANIGQNASLLGASAQFRQYYIQAIDRGEGAEFVVGRQTKAPGFRFSARVGPADAPLGVIVTSHHSADLSRLVEDPTRQMFVTDQNGVIVLGNRISELMGRTPVMGDNMPSEAAQKQIYTRVPNDLGWRMSSLKLGHRDVALVERDDGRFMAVSSPIRYLNLRAWALIPLAGEGTLMAAWAGATGVVLVSGLGGLLLQGQRQRKREAIARSEQALGAMAHALPLTVFRFVKPDGEDGQFSFIGHGVDKLLGLSEASLQSSPHSAWELMGTAHPPVPPTKAIEFSVRIGGRHRWIRCESTCTEDQNGTLTYNGYWSDITARKQVEARSLAVFQHAPVAFIFYNPGMGIVRCNPRAIEMFGATGEGDLLQLDPLKSPLMAPGGVSAETMARILALEPGAKACTVEMRQTRLDGETFDAEVVLIPFEQDGSFQICALMQDITQRKQTETALRNAQAASDAATAAKSRFLANLSHEIRTPMNAIMGMTHLALLDELPEKARNYVDKAHRSAANLLQILNDVLDVSKIESGKLELENTDFQLESVISHMADVLGMRAEEKGLELLFTAPPDIPTALIGDPMRLGQVLINLGTNAVKFTEKGEVLIGCEVQRLDTANVVLHFWVRDSGIGMGAELIDRLFQPFMQGDSSTTRQYGGTGLGLTISRQLVEMMGGRIWVNSQAGRGSTFHFTARFGLQAQPQSRRALLATELQGKRVLLVDDNPTAREVLGDMARRLGLDVDVVDSGEQGMVRMQQAANEGRPHHVLLTDWKMPGMDGISFARQALSVSTEQRPCVLLVTAFAREEALKAAHGVGLAGVINKPVTPSTLLDSLARVLGHTVSAPPSPRQTGQVLQQAQRQLAGARVLLVEDQALNQELACDLLQRAGVQVVTASNGQECLDMLSTQGPFDGVLMDCQMPVMDGYSATERIRAQPQWHSLPVIAMTASAMAADRDRVMQCGMNDHITQPLDLAHMFNTMARWITPSGAPTSPPHPDATAPTPSHVSASIDTADGLSRCMGNMDLYRRLLKGFAKTQHDFALQFDRKGGDGDAALSVVHTLKGLAGTIGATQLLQAATCLELALHAHNPAETPDQRRARIHAELALTLVSLQAVMADIERLNRPSANAVLQQQTAMSDQALREQLDRIADLVADNDAQAREVLQDLLRDWPSLRQNPGLGALKLALSAYDFEAASKALLELQEAHQAL